MNSGARLPAFKPQFYLLTEDDLFGLCLPYMAVSVIICYYLYLPHGVVLRTEYMYVCLEQCLVHYKC